MKNKIFIAAVLTVFVSLSCSQGYNKSGNSSVNKKNPRAIRANEAPSQLNFPLLNGGNKKFDVVKGYYIVKTKKDFDKSVFLTMGARIEDVMAAEGGCVFWYIYKNDNFFIKKILQTEGVISAEYDFTVYRINPPRKYDEQLMPAPIGEDWLVGDREKLMSLEDGDMNKDPRMNAANYSLQITKALEAYKQYKDDHFKKNVLLGIIDTGFNYCHEDYWFKNNKGLQESIAYFVKSAYLLSRDTENFDYTLSSSVNPDIPAVDYAKDWIKANTYSRKFYEIPCTKVHPGSGSSSSPSSPDNSFFWNWDNGSHGTHCTGMMAARGDNDKGVTGVSWKNTKIASYKCFGGSTGGKSWEIYGALADYADYIEAGKAGKLNELYSNPVEAIDKKDGTSTSNADNPYANEQEKFNPYKDQGTYPVNMSLGGPLSTNYSGAVIARCLKLGILPVVAMGNDGQRITEFPSSYDGSMAIGASNGRDQKTDFSGSGEWNCICAPGDGILSTGVEPVFNYPFAGYWRPRGSGAPYTREISKAYETMSGTSMATPFVTGVLGYLLSFENAHTKKPGWFRAVLQSTADPMQGQTKGVHHEDYGYGRVNVLEAAKHAKEGSNPSLGSEGQFDYNTENTVKFSIKNKRRPKNSTARLGLAGHPVYVYDSKGNPAAFNYTNNNGEVEFFFLPKRNGADYFARANINGEFVERKFNINGTAQSFEIEYDSPIVYISTFTPHSEFFKKYSVDGRYDEEPDTVISIYEEGKFDEPIARYDYFTLDTMAFNATAGKTYYAEITCFQDPVTGRYRDGMYGIRIGFDSNYSTRFGNNDFVNPITDDAGKVHPVSGMKIYELINGQDCWEPNDDFEQAKNMGDFMGFAESVDLQTYILGCLTHQSDGLDTDIYKFTVPEYDEYAED